MIFETPTYGHKKVRKDANNQIIASMPPAYEERNKEMIHLHQEVKQILEERKLREQLKLELEKKSKLEAAKDEKRGRFKKSFQPQPKKKRPRIKTSFSKNTSDEFLKDLKRIKLNIKNPTEIIHDEESDYVSVRFTN